ncbi:MAG TPA: hypothetical protein DD706_18505 [Nitrospiraceae bacterium]|nr:hypothetical protein [Nitrospiraceae bacterium]
MAISQSKGNIGKNSGETPKGEGPSVLQESLGKRPGLLKVRYGPENIFLGKVASIPDSLLSF